MTEKKTLANRVAAIMGSIGGVEKKGKITSQGSGPSYKFAADPDVLKAVIPKFADEGIVMVPEQVELLSIEPNMRGTQLIASVRTHWLVTDGTEEIRFQSLGMGQDSGDKALPKAQTNARKYALFMLLHIVTGDDPDQWSSDADEHRPPVQRQAPTPPTARARLASVASSHGISAADLERYAEQVGASKPATDEQIEQIIALIETPEVGLPTPPATPQESTPSGDQGSGQSTPPAATSVQPAGDSPPVSGPAAPSDAELLAAAGPGAELVPPRPGTDEYKALPDGNERSKAKAYWDRKEPPAPKGARETKEAEPISAALA